MIIVRITGGLGNQLFKISQAYRYIKKYKLVYVDTNFYLNDRYERIFHFASLDDLKVIPAKLRVLIFKFRKMYKNLGLFKHIDEKDSNSKNISFLKINYLTGNWEENAIPSGEILQNFKNYFKIHELSDKKESIVAVHFRRLHYQPLLDMEYYKKAIAEFLKSNNKIKFHFYSDDLNFLTKEAVKIFHNLDFEVLHNKNEIDEFRELTTYQNYIMSNSTFSWWTVVLNKEINKKVYFPDKWENDREYNIHKYNSWLSL